jgi:hypothetical protein
MQLIPGDPVARYFFWLCLCFANASAFLAVNCNALAFLADIPYGTWGCLEFGIGVHCYSRKASAQGISLPLFNARERLPGWKSTSEASIEKSWSFSLGSFIHSIFACQHQR